MSVDVITETEIERPTADVAAYAGDPANAPTWYVNIKSAVWQTPPPLAVGSRIDFVAHFLGRKLSYTYVPDGDDVHLGTADACEDAHDLAQPRRAVGVLEGVRAPDGERDEEGDDERPRAPEGPPRAAVRRQHASLASTSPR